MKNMHAQEPLKKIVVIVGPTASGKSGLAVMLAKKFGGGVVSADSRQVYKGLDIGTGKVTPQKITRVPHHLLDVASPRRVYTVTDFVTDARTVIAGIVARGKLPIIAGGTAFYIDTLLGDTSPAPVPPNEKLRAKLEKKTKTALVEILEKIDPRFAQKIDTKNPHRLIRAIEIATALGRIPPLKKKCFYDALKVGIRVPHETLKEKIHARLASRMKQGMIAEAQLLHEKGLSWKRMETLGLEYRSLARYLQKEISKQEMLMELEAAICRYGKRQMTWWKRDVHIKWYTPHEYEKIETTIAEFLTTDLL